MGMLIHRHNIVVVDNKTSKETVEQPKVVTEDKTVKKPIKKK
jgi:hypothetical protein